VDRLYGLRMSTLDLLDRLFGVKRPHGRFLERRIPPNVNYFYCLGGITFTLFLTLLVTGLALSAFYVPSGEGAFESIARLKNQVAGGLILRSVHRWSAHFMVICLLLHVSRVVVSGAYRPPRQLNWLAGMGLMCVTFGFGFTGYLLPWDQKAYWATVVGTSMVESVPLVGAGSAALLRGDLDVGPGTLVRFYALHTLWFPLIAGALLWAHFHMTKKRGIYGGL